MTRSKPNVPTTTVANRGDGNINNVEESTMSDKNSNSGVIVLRGDVYDAKRCKVVPEAGMDQAFPDGNAAMVFGTRVVAEILKAHAAKKPDDDPYAFMMVGGGVVTFEALTVENDTIATVTVSMDTAQAKPKTVAKKRPVAATKPPVKKAPAKKTVADAPAKAPAVRKRPTPPAATAAPARKTAPAKKAAPAAPRKTVAAAPAKAPARKTAPPAKKAPARKSSK